MPERRAGWLLDEVASAGRENLDAEHVARYARGEAEQLVNLGLDQHSVLVERSGFEITDAIYSQDRIFARYIARAGRVTR